MTLVTIGALYGAGGSRVAPALAQRLGVPFLERPPVPELQGDEEARACDERLGPGGLLSRIASMAVSWGTPAGLTAEELVPDEARRRELEQELRDFAASGRGVILGRGAAVLLRDDERALHVLLDGPEEARLEQAMEIMGKLRGVGLDPNVVDALRRVVEKKGVRLEGSRHPVRLAS